MYSKSMEKSTCSMACEVLHKNQYKSFLLTNKCSQASKIPIDHMNNITAQTASGEIFLDSWWLGSWSPVHLRKKLCEGSSGIVIGSTQKKILIFYMKS